MSYTKTTWVTGDTVTADKLNNIEDGIEAIDMASAPLVFEIECDTDEQTYTIKSSPMTPSSLVELLEDSSPAILVHYTEVMAPPINLEASNEKLNVAIKLMSCSVGIEMSESLGVYDVSISLSGLNSGVASIEGDTDSNEWTLIRYA